MRRTINPSVTAADVREMLIQHILTEEIFSHVFDNTDFHRRNNVAKELFALENTFFTGKVKHGTLAALRPYYAAIKSAAALVTSHHEKQKFIKTIYENFYKVYDKKKADRLGVVYTPNEIVRFMIESADWLCQKHFGRALIDKGVEILDPAAGTGTFIAELIEHFRGQPAKLAYKYREELHANEVAILSYYVANLNIEATYAVITGEYEDYQNLCFVDTLDNTAGLRTYGVGKDQHFGDLFGAVSEENVARIKRQNARKISVIIGNPPYNANQLNENENNKNREYPEIDRRIKETYIKASTAQKTKRYDMYSRFFRWASDRIDDNGVIAFITNRNFIDAREADGFRKYAADEFNDIYVVDLGGDVRADPRLSGTKHNVFGIQTGVAISFLVKRAKAKGCRTRYARRPELETAEEKLAFLQSARLSDVAVDEVKLDACQNWLNQTGNDYADLIPIATKETKAAKTPSQERAIFRLVANAIKTNRDEWVYAHDKVALALKVRYFLNRLNAQIKKGVSDSDALDYSIKWSSSLKTRRKTIPYDESCVVESGFRPFVKNYFYADPKINDRLTENHVVAFGECLSNKNVCLYFVFGSRLDFCVLAIDIPTNYALVSVDPVQFVSRFRFGQEGQRLDNITDWALEQFRAHYERSPSPGAARPPLPRGERVITKDAIFHYVYGVLHDPVYREKYALNLKREFPRIPFYADFWQWADWGEELMKLHIGYETIGSWPLERIDNPDQKSRKAGLAPKALLRANKESGNIQLDTETQLTGVPPQAWNYRLGNRSALEWILDQYKEKTPKDPTIREKFNTYRFADYKEKVIDLLKRVTRVSVETVAITEAMKTAKR
ncbi:MAG TPA: type ISP restriction/modification enzyme [Methylocella sp.]|nr:type ISP restriction/modification enzyme [Methylocella sp.]